MSILYGHISTIQCQRDFIDSLLKNPSAGRIVIRVQVWIFRSKTEAFIATVESWYKGKDRIIITLFYALY